MHGTCLNVQKSNFSLVLLNEKKAKKKKRENKHESEFMFKIILTKNDLYHPSAVKQ